MKYPEKANLQREQVDWWLPGAKSVKGSDSSGHEGSFGGDEYVLMMDFFLYH